MIIPLATPQDREVINLFQVVRLISHGTTLICRECGVIHTAAKPAVTLEFSNGEKQVYRDDAATFINIEIGFALKTYRDFQKGIERAESGLVTANGMPPTVM